MTDPLFIISVLAANVILAEWLCRRTFCRHFGTAMVVLVTTAVTANLGAIPTSTGAAPVYGDVFDYVAPLCIFWLLLAVDLRDVAKAGGPMIALFLVGSAGTCLGVVVGMWAVDGADVFGTAYRGLGGTFVGTYTGGAANFTAVATYYDLNDSEPVLYAGMIAVDNFFTLVWMVVTLAVPQLWKRGSAAPAVKPAAGEARPGGLPQEGSAATPRAATAAAVDDDTQHVHPVHLAVLLATGAGALWFSNAAAAWVKANGGLSIPPVLVLTTLSLLLAQARSVRRWLAGSQVLGMFSMYLFLAVIGAICDVSALGELEHLALPLVGFVALVVGTHGIVTFAAARVFRLDPAMAAVASQANIGGATTALALSRGLRRRDLSVPGILVGALGYAIGTYLGFAVARWLL